MDTKKIKAAIKLLAGDTAALEAQIKAENGCKVIQVDNQVNIEIRTF